MQHYRYIITISYLFYHIRVKYSEYSFCMKKNILGNKQQCYVREMSNAFSLNIPCTCISNIEVHC